MTAQTIKDFDLAVGVDSNATTAVSKLVKAWESKNARRALRGSGLGLMAVSLAACGGSSDDGDGGTVEPPPPAVTPITATLTIGQDLIDGTTANDTVTAPILEGQGGGLDQTLNTIDEIDLGDGIDTLTATLGDDAGAPLVSGVEVVILRSVDEDVLGDDAEVVFNVDGFTGFLFLGVTGDDVVTSLVFNANGEDSTFEFEDNDEATSVTITGTAAIEIEQDFEFFQVTSFDFSANSGGVTIDRVAAGNDEDFTMLGSSGDDVITIGENGDAGRTINLGAGDDTLIFTAGSTNEDDTLNGGAGVDEISVDLDEAQIAVDVAVGFERLTLTGAAAGAVVVDLEGSSIATVEVAGDLLVQDLTVGGYGGERTIVISADGLDGVGASLTVESVDASDEVNISFDAGVAVDVTLLDLTDVEVVNISTASEDDDVTLVEVDLDGVESLTVSGEGNFAATATGADGLETVDLSGVSGEVDFSVDVAGDIGPLTITLGDFAAGSSIVLDSTEGASDVIVLGDVLTGDTDLGISNFTAGPAVPLAERDVLDLSEFGLTEADLVFVDGGANTLITFETAGGDDVSITLVGVTGLELSELVTAGNLVL